MFRAIGRYIRAFGYLITGRIDDARRSLSSSPAVVQATYDRVIEEKTKRIHQYKEAVGAMIAQQEKKKSQITRLTEEIDRLSKLRDGAAAMARKVVERHHGDAEAVKNDPEYVKCQTAFKDFSSTLSEKQQHWSELEEDIKAFDQNISGHKTQLQSLLREIDKVKQEKHETVAEMLTAKEEKEIADMLTGISKDRTHEELQELREVRDQAKATARVSREMAGIDTKRSEAEFMEYASSAEADNEFDKLIGLTQAESKATTSEAADRTRIPEH
jgi:chromosome segregation ATPase